MSKLLGLIGYPLSHSFSKKYFSEKFKSESIEGYRYELFPLPQIGLLPGLIKEHPDLVGLNVTIPYKELVLDFLDGLDEAARQVGAVNTIKIRNGYLIGYNTDVYGFSQSLCSFFDSADTKLNITEVKALILGTGGASKAVEYVLKTQDIPFLKVSRKPGKGDIVYKEIARHHLQEYNLIINTTPLGMAPNTASAPEIPYKWLNEKNILYDLVYNPEKTVFLSQGNKKGSATINGLRMLHLQAEKAWNIWREN